ncbi:MAG: type II toxin-antitoxin system VapC family toxin [Terracidiphilus sp.]
MILADTSVWIDHLRAGNPRMQELLDGEQIIMHPMIVAELGLGSLRQRAKTLAELDGLLEVKTAQLSKVRRMIEVQRLYGKGIGLIDAHLVASCLITPGTQLWTRDTALKGVAKAVGVDAGLP